MKHYIVVILRLELPSINIDAILQDLNLRKIENCTVFIWAGKKKKDEEEEANVIFISHWVRK